MLATTEDSKFRRVFCDLQWYFTFSFVGITTSGTFSSLGGVRGWEEVWIIAINEGKRKKIEMPGEIAAFLLGCYDFCSLLKTDSKATKLQFISRNRGRLGLDVSCMTMACIFLFQKRSFFNLFMKTILSKNTQGFSSELLFC